MREKLAFVNTNKNIILLTSKRMHLLHIMDKLDAALLGLGARSSTTDQRPESNSPPTHRLEAANCIPCAPTDLYVYVCHADRRTQQFTRTPEPVTIPPRSEVRVCVPGEAVLRRKSRKVDRCHVTVLYRKRDTNASNFLACDTVPRTSVPIEATSAGRPISMARGSGPAGLP